MLKRYLIGLALLLCTQISLAVDLNLESMLSPGKLSHAHSGSDIECKSCHEDFARHNQNNLCLSCHEKVAADITHEQGFHGRKPGLKNSECRICHTEHQGADADIVQLNPHQFPHQFTDYPLKGLHATVECAQCHKKDAAFRDAPGECVQCHKDDDVHQGKQGDTCTDCHSPEGWRKTRFDHSTTNFPLTGAHKTAECLQCHLSADYTEAKETCVSCHQLDDVHLNSFGTECDSCHNTDKWKSTRFDHQRDTDFVLKGKHRQLACATCHKPMTTPGHALVTHPEINLPDTCYGCHQHDDVHFGKNGKECDQCHNNQQWKDSRFNHQDTGFPLLGAHQQLDCKQCHEDDVHARIKNKTCSGCHQQDDVHRRTLGTDCKQCHNENNWRQGIVFDHELTSFPLLGMHATTFCESCHSDFQFKGINSSCNDCHSKEDPHNGHLGTECANCHHPTGWELWRFDHNTQTDFKLEGAHQGMTCDACHQQNLESFSAQGKQCGNCHQADDVHRGAYGSQCQHCHSSDDFSELNMR